MYSKLISQDQCTTARPSWQPIVITDEPVECVRAVYITDTACYKLWERCSFFIIINSRTAVSTCSWYPPAVFPWCCEPHCTSASVSFLLVLSHNFSIVDKQNLNYYWIKPEKTFIYNTDDGVMMIMYILVLMNLTCLCYISGEFTATLFAKWVWTHLHKLILAQIVLYTMGQ